MENNKITPTPLTLSEEQVQPIVLIAQLTKMMSKMQHADEVFLWLANAMIRGLNIPVIQFWASQQDNTGQFHTEVRAIASQNPALPQHVHLNTHVMVVIERLFHEQRSITSLPIEGIFSPLQTTLFAQYNLHYWASFLLRNDALLPPAKTGGASGKIPTPLVMIVTLFTQLPLTTDQARSTRFTLEQALRMTIKRGFLNDPSSALFEPEQMNSGRRG
jgi:hypothetical protein